MRLAHLEVKNFKGLRAVELPLSRFVCVIGPNNAGKSSLLQSLLKFVEGGKLAPAQFYDPTSDIAISVKLDAITDDDLAKLATSHRAKIEPLLSEGSITLVRRYSPDGNGKLRRIALVPADARFSEDAIEVLVKGKKSGAGFAADVLAVFPELKDEITSKSNQGDVKAELINKHTN
jgi:energy-coupling factor transporter ATP-binding protein EcfA2